MCGRFALFSEAEAIQNEFSLMHAPELEPRYNIAPGSEILAVTIHGNHQFDAQFFRWGLIPSWAKDEKLAFSLLNARSETIDKKPAFKRAFHSRRCLVVADGYYEWYRENGVKQPYYFKRKDKRCFAIAGIWEYWRHPSGEMIHSCSLVTTAANDLMRSVHERMPAIIPPREYATWLDIESYDPVELKSLLLPDSSNLFEMYPVSTKMNNARYQDSDAVELI